MFWNNMPDLAPLVGLVIAIVAWLLMALYGLWRSHRLSGELGRLRKMASFFDSVLMSERKHPIWLWKEGKIQASEQALEILDLTENVDTLDDLKGETSSGISQQTIDQIKRCVHDEKTTTNNFVVQKTSGNKSFIIGFRRLVGAPEKWPGCVLWVEEYLSGKKYNNERKGQIFEDRLHELVSVLEAIPLPIWTSGTDGKLLDVNTAYVKAVEGESELDVIRRGQVLFPGQSVVPERLEKQKNNHSAHFVRTENTYAVVGGKRCYFNVFHIPLDSERTLNVAVDVTGEQSATKELKRVLDAHEETLNRLRSPVAIFSACQTLQFFNRSFAHLSGLDEKWLANHPSHSEVLDAMRDKRRIPEQADYKLWRSQLLGEYTSLIEPKEVLWHLPDSTVHRVVSQPHPLGGLLVLFEDITDRLALQQSYNTLMAVQQETLDHMREGVAVVSSDGRLQLANPAFLSLWGLNSDQIKGSPRFTPLVEKLEAKPVPENGVQELNFKESLPAWLTERTVRKGRWHHKDGRAIDFAIVPLPDGGMMLTQVDVTDTYRIEQALRERSRALEVADRLKSQFITNMSYELRTPLNSIIGFAELLDQQLFGSLNDSQHVYVRDILKASEELKAMISDVLDLAVIEAGEMTLEIENVDLVSAVNESAILAQELAHKANMLLTLQVNDDVSTVMGDKRRLKQAFYNMVSAMLTLGRYGGVLTLSLESKNDNVRVVVTNPDCGLAPIDRDNLLASIEMGGMPQGHRATGLDLALVRSIAALHGGKVMLEPLEDEGFLLICELPRTQKPTRIIEGKKAS